MIGCDKTYARSEEVGLQVVNEIVDNVSVTKWDSRGVATDHDVTDLEFFILRDVG